MNAPVGRPRDFDEEVVLDELTALFWRQGYSQTSMSDIESLTGVHRPTLYRVFGTKAQMFETVLRRYMRERLSAFAELLEGATEPGLAPLRTVLESYRPENLSSEGRHGCLVVAAMAELHGTHVGFEDFASSYRDGLRSNVASVIATADPSLGPEPVAQRTDLFVTLLIGLLLIIRSGPDASELNNTIQAINGLLDTWDAQDR